MRFHSIVRKSKRILGSRPFGVRYSWHVTFDSILLTNPTEMTDRFSFTLIQPLKFWPETKEILDFFKEKFWQTNHFFGLLWNLLNVFPWSCRFLSDHQVLLLSWQSLGRPDLGGMLFQVLDFNACALFEDVLLIFNVLMVIYRICLFLVCISTVNAQIVHFKQSTTACGIHFMPYLK